MRSFIQKHALVVFYILAFAISWTCLLIVVGPSGFPGTPEKMQELLPLGIVALLAGPSTTGLFMTWLIHGKTGLRELWSRLAKWQVGARWYLLAFFLAPGLMLASHSVLAIFSPRFLPGMFSTPDKAPLIILAVMGGLGAGIFEELGWTGFANPLLRRHSSIFATGLLMGFLWGAWHYIVNFWGSGNASGGYDLDLLLPSLLWSLTILPAYRVLMVWVYDRTQSLLVAMLMHMSLTSSMILLDPVDKAGLLTYDLVLASSIIIVTVFVMMRVMNGRPQSDLHLSEAPMLPAYNQES